MEIYGIPIFDDDFYKMLFRFCINISFLTIIIRCLYYKRARNKEYFFTYYMISVIVFFLCFTLKKFELDLGMALGLFAIFGIIRYRTNSIDIKEMTYLFVVIGVSVINSLANKKMSYVEVFSANLLIILVLSLTEWFWGLKHQISRKIVYDILENLKPENDFLLKADLKNKTGFNIDKVKIEEVDYKRKRANMIIYYENK
ncbi:DUF4956 domain-containing protein [Wenyingzhuangia aestuarii]|uniref:DUF4956 domain-containing protein n=1 Tax=Wenyingzhuangia aestuarii TaxID=1647582 RepID=UPI001439F39E|nr:DUF4956 domain-containing protein [Wenyingzhuangia aestuarii]NJB83059.1 hypothetical protein [Wenyingzhuangia aestuarii]